MLHKNPSRKVTEIRKCETQETSTILTDPWGQVKVRSQSSSDTRQWVRGMKFNGQDAGEASKEKPEQIGC
jgi:hypothetical protein